MLFYTQYSHHTILNVPDMLLALISYKLRQWTESRKKVTDRPTASDDELRCVSLSLVLRLP